MKNVTVIETAEELAYLVRNRLVTAMPEGEKSPPRLPDGAKLVVNDRGQVTVEAEGFTNMPIHYFDLFRVVAEGYGVKVEAGV